MCAYMWHSHACLYRVHTQPVAVCKGDKGAAKREDKKALDKEVKKLLKDQADKCVCGGGGAWLFVCACVCGGQCIADLLSR